MYNLATAVICERWPIPLGEQGKSAWFLDWVLRRPKESSIHVTAGFAAYRSLRVAYPEEHPFETATEYFGGLGCQSLMIQEMYRPREHTVVELNTMASEHLRALLKGRPSATVRQADAFTVDYPADLVGLDFGNLTILQAQQGALRPLLDQVFAAGPKGVVLTDIAGQRLHLQRERYEGLLNHDCSTYPDYLEGLAKYLNDTYGYQALSCYYHRWSAVMALVPASLGISLVIEPVPEGPRGIELR